MPSRTLPCRKIPESPARSRVKKIAGESLAVFFYRAKKLTAFCGVIRANIVIKCVVTTHLSENESEVLLSQSQYVILRARYNVKKFIIPIAR